MDLLVVKDAYGTLLQVEDMVTMFKDLKVKGTSSVAKIGAKVKINSLVDGDHNIDCKITGIGVIILKSEFFKKA
jgi:protein PhnA